MVGVQAKVPSSTSQPNSPPDQVSTLFAVQVESPAPLKRALKRLVEEAVVEKREVVVAEVEVEFEAVKFWRVEEPFERRVPKVPSPVEVKLPPLAVVKKRLVDEAVVEKKEVEVALVEVE